MRSFVIGFILITAICAVAKDPETTEQLKARAEVADPGKQGSLYLDLSERQLHDADVAYNSNADRAKTVLEDAIQSAEKAAEASLKSGKSLKKVEIGLRKISKRLEDLSRSWALEDRPPLAAGIQKIDRARSKLLDRMFQK